MAPCQVDNIKYRATSTTWLCHQGVALPLPVLATHERRVWAGIPLEEVRARIKEMPARCQELIKRGGVAIESEMVMLLRWFAETRKR